MEKTHWGVPRRKLNWLSAAYSFFLIWTFFLASSFPSGTLGETPSAMPARFSRKGSKFLILVSLLTDLLCVAM